MSLLPWTLSQGVRRARRGDHVKSEASRAECARPEHLRGFSPPGREQRALTGFIGVSHGFFTFISNGLPVDDRPDEVRVLVVDDEPSIVDVISMALRYQGFGVEAAVTGPEALERVRRWRPHVIVLDVMLPDMMGFDVARRLSAEHAAVPILFLSAEDSTADKVRGLTTGGDDYVTKPFSLEEMIARLRNILRRTGTIREMSSRVIFADLELDEDTFDHG